MKKIFSFIVPSTTLILLFIFTLPSCARKDVTGTYKFEYYPSCQTPLIELPKTSQPPQTFNAGAGNFIFSAIGKIIGDGFDIIGTTLDTAADIVTGKRTNNAYDTNQTIADDNLRMASYQENLGNEFSALEKSRTGARESLLCYRQNFKALLAGIENGSIDRLSAQKRFAEIMAGRERAIYILNNLIIFGKSVANDYENSLNLEAQNTGLRGTAKAVYLTRIKAASTQAAEMNFAVNAIIQERNEARQETTQMTRQINELMNPGGQ